MNDVVMASADVSYKRGIQDGSLGIVNSRDCNKELMHGPINLSAKIVTFNAFEVIVVVGRSLLTTLSQTLCLLNL